VPLRRAQSGKTAKSGRDAAPLVAKSCLDAIVYCNASRELGKRALVFNTVFSHVFCA